MTIKRPNLIVIAGPNGAGIADTWVLYDNSGEKPRLVAHEDQEHRLVVIDSVIWHNIKNKYGSQKKT